MPGIKTKASKTGSYSEGTKAQVQGKAKSKSQQDLDEMSANYANKGAALRSTIPVGNQSYADFQKTRKSPQGQLDKDLYERTNKLPRLTDADYQTRVYNKGFKDLAKTADANPDTSVFNANAKNAAYGAQNKTSMETGNQVSGSNGSVVDAASLADRSKRMEVSSSYSAPGMSTNASPVSTSVSPLAVKPIDKSLAVYDKGTKNIKTNMNKKKFEDSAEDKKVDAKAIAKMNKTGKYADGSKGIKVKSKGGMSNFINGESDKVKTMSDEDLKSSVMRNMNFQTTKQNAKEKELLDETVSRKQKKQGGYEDGTKSIKTSKKTTIAQDDAKNEKEKPSKVAYQDKPSMKQLETTAVKKKYAIGTKGIKTKKMC